MISNTQPVAAKVHTPTAGMRGEIHTRWANLLNPESPP